MKTILVATDFSDAALNAAHYAADMAVAIDADIHLMHAYEIPVTYSELPIALNLEHLLRDAETNIHELKVDLAERTRGQIKIEAAVVSGTFFQQLKETCTRIQPYVVVMGSQGTTAAERLLFGSHAVYAMTHLKWPLITVPAHAVFTFIKNIGIACDLHKVMDTVPADEIKMLVNDFNAELHILNTGKKEVYDSDIVFESGVLGDMLGKLKPHYHFLTSKSVDEGIIDFAEHNNIDLLIVIPKRHGLIEKIMHKSKTKCLVLQSHVPVMALHKL